MRTANGIRVAVASAAAAVTLLATVALAAPAGATSVTPVQPPTLRRNVVVLTQADNGRTVRLRPGETVVVLLRGHLNWTVRSTNPRVISRATTPLSARIPIFATHAPGTARLVGLGQPVCSPAQACPMYRVRWHVNIVVRYAVVPYRLTW